jgi:hypothetical protein
MQTFVNQPWKEKMVTSKRSHIEITLEKKVEMIRASDTAPKPSQKEVRSLV